MLTVIRCNQLLSVVIRSNQKVVRSRQNIFRSIQKGVRDMSECIRRRQLRRVDFVLRSCAIIGYIQN